MVFGRSRTVFAGWVLALTGAAAGVGGGCADNDRPTEYGRQRPPIDELDPRDRGLQSTDVLRAADQVIAALMALPELQDSDRRWTLVITDVEDRTNDRKFRGIDYNIFLEKLKANIAKQGRGSLRLIENREKFYDIRSRELESELEGGDEFGQGEDSGPARAPQAISPDFGLKATASDLVGRGTTYYLINFEITNLKTRELVFVEDYNVRVSRDR
jgi:hypothetical protein